MRALSAPARLGLALALGAVLLAAGCPSCDPHAEIASAKARFPRLSAGRPLGSPCSPTDSASVRRAARHPLLPTGGWPTTAEVDSARTLERGLPAGASAVMVLHASVLAGYVRFDAPGTLQVRAYDDVFGSVYGGWSPAALRLAPTAKPVFVALGRSAYGDGGLDPVHEVCWTPDGALQGVVVHSTAHAPRVPPLRAREYFRKADLGSRGRTYDDRLALQVLAETVQDREVAAARAFLDEARAMLASLPDAVDGTTGAPLPARVFLGREWADLEAFRLGLSVGAPGFAAADQDFQALLEARLPGRNCYGCERYERMLPLYRWLDARARGQDAPPPDPGRLAAGVHGYDPVAIARHLRGPGAERHRPPSMRFWSGVKAFHEGDRALARAELSAWLALPTPAVASGFELGAAAALLEKLE